MNNYIYLNFEDLRKEKQDELIEMAREDVAKETTQEEADEFNMDINDLINERIDRKLIEYSHKGLFVFNI